MPTLGTKLYSGLPREFLNTLSAEESAALLVADTTDELKKLLADKKIGAAVDRHMEQVRTSFGDDWQIMHQLLQGNKSLVPGALLDPLVKPDPRITSNLVRLPENLDEEVAKLYQELVSWQPTWSVRRAWTQFRYRQEDRVNATLGKHPDLLGALMKFVDVTAEIATNPAEVIDHLRDYFPSDDVRLPKLMRLGIHLAKQANAPVYQKFVSMVITKAIESMARRYIAGETVVDAKPKLHQLAKDGVGIIADILGEGVKSESEAIAYLEAYKQLVTDLAEDAGLVKKQRVNWKRLSQGEYRGILPKREHRYDFQVALKLSSLYSQWKPEDPEGTKRVVKERLRQLLNKIIEEENTRNIKIGLTIDLEQFAYRDLTYQIVTEVLNEDAYKDRERVGVVVQAYLKDAPQVIHDLAAWSKKRSENGGKSIQIRLVKGAYVDYERLQAAQKGYPNPVVADKQQADINFLDCMDLLFAYKDFLRASIASHNDQSLLEAVAKAKELNVPLELQALLGMQDTKKAQFHHMGLAISGYVPIGKLLPGMAYLARRFLENASQSNFLYMVASGEADAAKLLSNPRKHPRPLIDRSLTVEAPAADINNPYQREPLTDFSRPENVAAVMAAIQVYAYTDYTTKPDTTGVTHNTDPALPIPAVDEDDDADLPEILTSLVDFNDVDVPFIRDPSDRVIDADTVFAALSSAGFRLLENKQQYTVTGDLEKINPADLSQKLGIVPVPASVDEIKLAVNRAEAGFRKWSQENIGVRVAKLRQVAQLMREEKAELTALIMLESSKSLKEADADVAEAIDFIEYYAREALKMESDNPDRVIKPRGVTAIISPWNFPLAILTGMTVGALVTGNSVVIKPSEETPLIAEKLIQLLRRADVNPQAVQLLHGLGSVGAEILRQPEIKTVAFTGSRGVGESLYKDLLPRGINVIAEMGGKNALIIDVDAHPDDVIDAVMNGKFGFAGQKCSAVDRLIIVGDNKRYKMIKDRLVEAMKALKVGDPRDPGNAYGALIRQKDKNRLLAVLSAIDSGSLKGTIVYDGRKHSVPENGYYLGPTLIESHDYGSDLYTQEFFGPHLLISHQPSIQNAVSVAQNNQYALTGGYIGRSPSRKQYVLDNWTRVGNLYINRNESGTTGAVVGENSFGGVGMSGINGSKAGGPQYLWQFVDVEWKEGEQPVENHRYKRLKDQMEMIQKYPKQWHPLVSPEGIKNYADFRPRGKGIILAEAQSLKNVAELVTAAQLAGNDYEVVLFDATDPGAADPLRVDMPPLFDVMREQFSASQKLAVTHIDKLVEKLTSQAIKWVAFANSASAPEALKVAATQIAPKQDFIRSVMTFTDPLAEFEKLAAMLFEPRTVSDNLSRHGFVAPEDEEGGGGGIQIETATLENQTIEIQADAADQTGEPVAFSMVESASPGFVPLGLGPVNGVLTFAR